MTTRREAAGCNKRGIKLILLSFTTHKTDDGTNVMNLRRPLGIHTGTVVRTNYCITCLQQRLTDSTQVSSTLTAVAEPCTAIDMNDYRIRRFLNLWQVDIAGMICLTITYVVDILPFLRGLKFNLLLKTAKASSWLRLCQQLTTKGARDE